MRYPVAEHGTRRLVLRRFPYNVFFRVGTGEIVVVAVAHQRRRPGYYYCVINVARNKKDSREAL